ncbi:MAG: amidinotransferase [Candidatus Melainabacteria bacterium GWF2_37_15]|nr:MAG: amidinotransferase [Candidatus Melainabacteria bacterium GWF2_37_15]
MSLKIFMCPPDYYYNIDYEINPWMKKGTACANQAAVERWNELKSIIHSLGAEVLTMKPQPGLPDIVFTANAALIYRDKAVISRFRHKERQPEEKFYEAWLLEQGFKTVRLPENVNFEGAGDALFSGETLYSGYIPRSDISSHAYISEALGIRIISLELVNPRFYHLDTCFCPLTDGYVMYYDKAFDEYGNRVIEANFPEEKRIVVNEEEAGLFSCNAVSISKSVIMNKTTDRLKKVLADKGFNTYEVDLSEFMKAGGSAKCLTLKLNEHSV